MPGDLDGPAFVQEEDRLLARVRLTPADASGESDHPRTTSGACAKPRQQPSRRARRTTGSPRLSGVMQLEAGGIRRAIAFPIASAGPSSQERSSRLGRPRYSFARDPITPRSPLGLSLRWPPGAWPECCFGDKALARPSPSRAAAAGRSGPTPGRHEAGRGGHSTPSAHNDLFSRAASQGRAVCLEARLNVTRDAKVGTPWV